jgi:hypothetical protein
MILFTNKCNLYHSILIRQFMVVSIQVSYNILIFKIVLFYFLFFLGLLWHSALFNIYLFILNYAFIAHCIIFYLLKLTPSRKDAEFIYFYFYFLFYSIFYISLCFFNISIAISCLLCIYC